MNTLNVSSVSAARPIRTYTKAVQPNPAFFTDREKARLEEIEYQAFLEAEERHEANMLHFESRHW